MGDEDDRGVERLELSFEPFETLDVEMVRRFVEKEQVRINRERAGKRCARQLPTGERLELSLEVVVAEAEPTRRLGDTVTPVPASGVLQASLCVRVPPKRGLVV